MARSPWVSPWTSSKPAPPSPPCAPGPGQLNRPVPTLVGHVPVAVTTDRDAVRAAARAQFGVYPRLPFYRNMFADSKASPSAPTTPRLPDA
ncbi:MAG: hypothetical protein U0232_09785 [Thermomicrobiales bacterium]